LILENTAALTKTSLRVVISDNWLTEESKDLLFKILDFIEFQIIKTYPKQTMLSSFTRSVCRLN
jgi:hypothetical protein